MKFALVLYDIKNLYELYTVSKNKANISIKILILRFNYI